MIIYLFCVKWKAIHIASMRYFNTVAELEAHVRTQTPEHWSGGEPWHAYRVWVANPSEENRVAASYAAASYASYASYAYAPNTARLRFRVLATMAAAGVLPNPLTEKP